MSTNTSDNPSQAQPDERECGGVRKTISPRLTAHYQMWSSARNESTDAWRCWRGDRSAESFAVYLAARDREDAALDALARAHEADPS